MKRACDEWYEKKMVESKVRWAHREKKYGVTSMEASFRFWLRARWDLQLVSPLD